MLNLRVPVAAAYIPKIRNSKRLPCGFIEKDIQASCILNQDNYRTVTSFNQHHNATYQFILIKRVVFTRYYSTYSTDLVKEKRLNQKIAKNVKNTTGSKSEVGDSSLIKIPIQSESEESVDPINEIKSRKTGTYSMNVDGTVLTEPIMLNASQPQPVTLQNNSQAVVLKPNVQPVMTKNISHSDKLNTNLLSNKKISSLDLQKMRYADLSMLRVPIPLHENDLNLFFNRMEEGLDKIRYHTLQLENSCLKVQQQGKMWYNSKQEKLYHSIVYQEILKGNITTRLITNKIFVLLAEKDPEKKVEKTVEKAKDVSKSLANIAIDKTKALIAILKDQVEKLKKKK